MELYLIFDGGNGASLDKDAYGSWILKDTKESLGKVKRRVVFGTGYTNNEAEYKTLIDALEFAVKTLDELLPVIDLTIEGDSDLVRNQIGTYILEPFIDGKDVIHYWTGWKVNAEHLLPLRDTARGLLFKFRSFKYNHIPRKDVVAVLGH